jgi:hypothetical protein
MDNSIPHGTHESPRNRPIFFFYIFRNLICCFANDDEIHFNGANSFNVGLEGFVFQTALEFLNLGNRIQNIPNPILPTST